MVEGWEVFKVIYHILWFYPVVNMLKQSFYLQLQNKTQEQSMWRASGALCLYREIFFAIVSDLIWDYNLDS